MATDSKTHSDAGFQRESPEAARWLLEAAYSIGCEISLRQPRKDPSKWLCGLRKRGSSDSYLRLSNCYEFLHHLIWQQHSVSWPLEQMSTVLSDSFAVLGAVEHGRPLKREV